MSKKITKSAIKCRATRSHQLNGTSKDNLQGIRVNIAHSQKRTLHDMAQSINNATSASVSDVLAVWHSLEEEIIRTLSDGDRVELGTLGTLRIEVGAYQRKSVKENITGKEIEFKKIIFAPSQRLVQAMEELTFECSGLVSPPLSDKDIEKALIEHFTKHEHLVTRVFASLANCSKSTAYRRIEELLAKGKLKKSAISSHIYEKGDNLGR